MVALVDKLGDIATKVTNMSTAQALPPTTAPPPPTSFPEGNVFAVRFDDGAGICPPPPFSFLTYGGCAESRRCHYRASSSLPTPTPRNPNSPKPPQKKQTVGRSSKKSILILNKPTPHCHYGGAPPCTTTGDHHCHYGGPPTTTKNLLPQLAVLENVHWQIVVDGLVHEATGGLQDPPALRSRCDPRRLRRGGGPCHPRLHHIG